MTILLVLIPLGLMLLGVAIAAFAWAVRNDQFEDLEVEAGRILFDEDTPRPPASAQRETGGGER
jgi:cbb3-type cytochrome oxidase maturation protein